MKLSGWRVRIWLHFTAWLPNMAGTTCCYLNAEGYKELGGIISKALLGKTVPADEKLAGIYSAVEDKNWHWHNRFRATDGNDIWGTADP